MARLLTDEHFPAAIANALRALGHDVKTLNIGRGFKNRYHYITAAELSGERKKHGDERR